VGKKTAGENQKVDEFRAGGLPDGICDKQIIEEHHTSREEDSRRGKKNNRSSFLQQLLSTLILRAWCDKDYYWGLAGQDAVMNRGTLALSYAMLDLVED
jgi:hypothetical protein